MVGTGQSTSEDSSALLLGFLKPHFFHIPDSCVTMGQAVSLGPLSSYACDGVISPALLVVSCEWRLNSGPGRAVKRVLPAPLSPGSGNLLPGGGVAPEGTNKEAGGFWAEGILYTGGLKKGEASTTPSRPDSGGPIPPGRATSSHGDREETKAWNAVPQAVPQRLSI